MPTNRTPIRRQRRPLSFSEEMSLEFGDLAGQQGPFESEEDREAAWERHRDYLMARFCQHGARPRGWWDYEAPKLGIRRPRDRDYEKATLWETGQLFESEVAALERRWREDFDQAQAADFSFCTGNDPVRRCAVWVKGAEARRAQYKWSGIPDSLVERWSKQRGRTIRKLARPRPKRAPSPAPSPAPPPQSSAPPSKPPPSTPPATPPLIG